MTQFTNAPQWGQPTGPTPRRADSRPLHKRKRVWAGGFLLFVLGAGCSGVGGAAGASSAGPSSARPSNTVTVTSTATAAPEEPEPTVTVTETETETEKVTATATVTVTREAGEDSSSGGGGSSVGGGGSSGGGSVYYRNCSEARAAGAAPVRRGAPGYGSHLDRDGDGVGCDWG
ncbi:hypothetical protein GCM10010406_08310 [Streptomyces thermolineatus]|uniref:Excalibur calcium-binding domain-containing protein n=1 Tax=Streptomyces thermolineatus TaxID=44033 RepID=A0ABP5Y3T0_9ACTN